MVCLFLPKVGEDNLFLKEKKEGEENGVRTVRWCIVKMSKLMLFLLLLLHQLLEKRELTMAFVFSSVGAVVLQGQCNSSSLYYWCADSANYFESELCHSFVN